MLLGVVKQQRGFILTFSKDFHQLLAVAVFGENKNESSLVSGLLRVPLQKQPKVILSVCSHDHSFMLLDVTGLEICILFQWKAEMLLSRCAE